MGHTGILASTMVLLEDAGLGRDHCSTGYNVLLDDVFLCRWASPGGWWLVLVGGLVCSANRCGVGRFGGSFGYGLWLLLGASFCLRLHYGFF